MTMDNHEQSRPKFFNYPEPKAYSIPYTAPPKENNPIFRGTPLAIGASIIARVSPAATYLYNNAGFNKLRDLKELGGIECRFDPTVIPHRALTDEELDVDFLRETTAKGKVDTRFYSIKDYHNAFKAGTITPIDVVNTLLPLIRRDVTPRSAHSTAFLSTNLDIVRAAAEASTLRYAAGEPLGVLDGVPVAVKDEVDVKGFGRCLGTAKAFGDGSAETSWCVAKWEEAGAVIIGKATMHEIGMDTTNLNSTHGTPLNPYNDGYYTGGSSGGSGYAVGAGLVPVALGLGMSFKLCTIALMLTSVLDGGGSIRIPSSFCGIFGLKTSHSRVSAYPSTCLTGTNTVIGPMAADVSSLEVAYRLMAAPDPFSTFPRPRKLSMNGSRKSKLIGIYKPWFERADAAVQKLCNEALTHMTKTQGYELIDISIPLIHEGQTAHALTILNEAANGHPDPSFLTPATRVLLTVGGKAPALDFLQAQRVRNLLMQHLGSLYQQNPGLLIVTPSTPTVGWKIKSPADLKAGCSDGDMSIRSMEYVWLANFTGCPCMQAPVGYATAENDKGNIPVGMMAMAEWGSEDALFEWGYDAEAYLNGIAGRKRPEAWVDVLETAGKKGMLLK